MKIVDHIAAVRGMLNEYGKVRVPFSDRFIYHHLKVSAAYFIRQKYDRNNTVNAFNFRFYAIATERTSISNCGCKGLCDVLATKYEIPQMLMTRGGLLLKVSTVDMREIPYVRFDDVDSLVYDPVRLGRLHYTLSNRKVILIGSDLSRPKVIMVGGYAEDPTDWAKITTCDSNGNDEGCLSINDIDLSIDPDILDVVYKDVLNKLIPASNAQQSERVEPTP